MILASESLTLDGSGNGSIRLRQVLPFTRWRVDRISVTITGGRTANQGGQVRIYRNSEIPGDFIDGSSTPWSDVYAGFAAPLVLDPPEAPLCVYSSCGASQRATVTFDGVILR